MCANEEKNKRDRKLEQAKVMGLGELVLVTCDHSGMPPCAWLDKMTAKQSQPPHGIVVGLSF